MLATRPPLLPEIGLLAMPYHHFGTSWMTPHHLLTRLARYFQVLWLEPPHHWRETSGLRRREAAVNRLALSLPDSFHVYVPEFWLPDIHRSPWLRRQLLRARVRHAARWLKARGCRSLVLYLWHPQYAAALATIPTDLSLYHIEDEYSFAPEPPPMDPGERRLIGDVDQVIIHSPRLMERKGSINPHTTVVPNGVDYRLYSSPMPEPSDVARIPHPRIGYTGNLKTQLDWTLLKNLAVSHTQWSFVFVGPRRFLTAPDRAILDEMANLPNVYFLGGKTVKELAVYPQHFDVCIMPYIVNGYTQNIYPMKLHEYLASGQPVVGSAIRSLEDFDQVIALARTDAEWSGAITRALAPALSTLEAAAARRAVAQKYDWSELTYRIVQTICERLNPALLGGVEKLTIDTPGFDSPAEGSREPQSPRPATAVTM